ncbi:MAG TPA: TRAP transporter small permease [Rubrivivax sp.]|nr:TRAP transporter small permease [Burkholderiales bacterium]HNT38462.1 TRAP transporter small permease [Rubrivivax sp.]
MKRTLVVFETIAALFLLAIPLLTFGNVALRESLGLQIPDWFDLSKQLQAIAMFWGIALATWRGGHICVDVLWEHCTRPWRRRIDLVATLLTLAFLAPMAWMVWVKLASTGTQTTSDLRLPLVWFYAVSAAGVSAAAVLAAARLVALWRERSPQAEEV